MQELNIRFVSYLDSYICISHTYLLEVYNVLKSNKNYYATVHKKHVFTGSDIMTQVEQMN